jgi:hypothetical protein
MAPKSDPQLSESEAAETPRVYAAALDEETCPSCAALAGLEYAAEDSSAPEIPNPRCSHPEGCRCGWL